MSDNKGVKKSAHKRLRRGIYLLPSLLTLSSMMAGFYSIVQIVQYYLTTMSYDFNFAGNIVYVQHACYALLLAMLFDVLDGRVARMTKTQSEFGAQLDSLSDLVSFGLSPALLVYYSILYQSGKLGWLVCFIYAACVALRLARFNSQDENVNYKYFRGLSSPTGAGSVICLVLLVALNRWLGHYFLRYIFLFLMPAISLLMVSKLRYRSFKDIDVSGKVPFFVVLFLLLLIAILVYHPALVLFIIFFWLRPLWASYVFVAHVSC